MVEVPIQPGHGIPQVRLTDYLFVPAVQDAQDAHLADRIKPDIERAEKAAEDARKARQGLEEAEANAKDYASHAEQAKEDAEGARDDINALVELLDPEVIATAVADYLAANPVEGVTVEDVLAEIAAHVGEADPHPQYVTADELPDMSDVVREGDSRLSDARTPTAHEHAAAEITGLAGVATSGAYADLTGQPDLSGYATTNALTEGLAGKADEGHSHTVESMATGSMDTGRVLAPDGVGGVGWVPAPSGGGGGSDPWVYSVVSAEATSDGTTDLANIPGLSIPAGLTAGVYQVKCMILSKATGVSQSYAFTSPAGGNLHIIAWMPASPSAVGGSVRVAAAIANPMTLSQHPNGTWGAPTLLVDGTLVVSSLMTSAVYLRYGVLTQGHTLTILPGSYLCYRRIA